MSRHGFSINSWHAKLRDGILMLEQCFSPLGFASCLLFHITSVSHSESHEQQTLLKHAAKLQGSSAVVIVTHRLGFTAEFAPGTATFPVLGECEDVTCFHNTALQADCF